MYTCKRCLKEFKFKSRAQAHFSKKKLCKQHINGANIDLKSQLLSLDEVQTERMDWKLFNKKHNLRIVDGRSIYYCSKCKKDHKMTKVTFKKHFDNCIPIKDFDTIKLIFPNKYSNRKYILRCDFLETVKNTYFNDNIPENKCIGKLKVKQMIVQYQDYMDMEWIKLFDLFKKILFKYLNSTDNFYGINHEDYAKLVNKHRKNLDKFLPRYLKPIIKQRNTLEEILKCTSLNESKNKDRPLKTLKKNATEYEKWNHERYVNSYQSKYWARGEYSKLFDRFKLLIQNGGWYNIIPSEELISNEKRRAKENIEKIIELEKKQFEEEQKLNPYVDPKEDKEKLKLQREIKYEFDELIEIFERTNKLVTEEDFDSLFMFIEKDKHFFMKHIYPKVNRNLHLRTQLKRILTYFDNNDEDLSKRTTSYYKTLIG